MKTIALYGVIVTVFVVGGFIFGLFDAPSKSLKNQEVQTSKASLYLPNNLGKLAVSDDAKAKETAKTLMDAGSKSPSELAVSGVTEKLKINDIKHLSDVLKKSKFNTKLFTTIYSKCLFWLKSSSLGGGEYTSEVKEKYHNSLVAPENSLKTISPSQLSKYLYDNKDIIDAVCNGGCPDTSVCANCWVLREKYLKAEPNSELADAIEDEMWDNDCSGSCANVCEHVKTTFDPLMTTTTNPGIRKAFIDNGITLN